MIDVPYLSDVIDEGNSARDPPVCDPTIGENGAYQGMSGCRCYASGWPAVSAIADRERRWHTIGARPRMRRIDAIRSRHILGGLHTPQVRCTISGRANKSQFGTICLSLVHHMDRGMHRPEQPNDSKDPKSQSEFGSTIARELAKRCDPCLVLYRKGKLRRKEKPVNGSEH